MRTNSELTALYARAAEATAAGSKSFYFATRFFPPELARAAHAVYWFCRYTDDLVDEAPSAAEGRAAIDGWEAELRRALGGSPPAHPVLAVFLDTLARHSIPPEYPLDLVAGVRMDLGAVRYETFTELRVFCYRVASVVGLMMMHVIGYRGPAAGYASDLGIAMQLTNILRDVGEDLERDRIYLPRQEMLCAGYSEEKLRARVLDESFRRLMRFEAARARDYYERAWEGIELLDPRGRFAVKVAARTYREILARIEAARYDVFRRRAVVPRRRKWLLAARTLAVPAFRHSLGRLQIWKATHESDS
jgi:phytoene synthase